MHTSNTYGWPQPRTCVPSSSYDFSLSAFSDHFHLWMFFHTWHLLQASWADHTPQTKHGGWCTRGRRRGTSLLRKLFLIPLHVNWWKLHFTTRCNAVLLFRSRQCLVVTFTVRIQFLFRIETFSARITFGLDNQDWLFRPFCSVFFSLWGCPSLLTLGTCLNL